MAETMQDEKAHLALGTRIRSIESQNLDEPEDIVARIIIGMMTPYERDVALLECVSDRVWEIRRNRQLAIERRASLARVEEILAQEEERQEAAVMAQKTREEEAVKAVAKEQAARRDREYEIFLGLMGEVGPRCRQWMEDPRTFPGDLTTILESTIRDSILPSADYGLDGLSKWLSHDDPLRQIRAYESSVSYLREADYDEYRRNTPWGFKWLDWYRAVAKDTGMDIDGLIDVVARLGMFDAMMNLQIEKAIQDEAARMRLEITQELLSSEFALGDGVRVTWADATVEQHEKRAAMTMRNAEANAEDASRHLAAVNLLQKQGVGTLREVADG